MTSLRRRDKALFNQPELPAVELVPCPECGGDGWTDCEDCQGLGYFIRFRPETLETVSPPINCDACCGVGDAVCPFCAGDGTVTADKAKGYREAIERGRVKG